ncbi:MAG: UDP-N-acetylglucosamine diphosphorylase [Candidatus Kerfeldbacteria bacterium CG15_BIG_FIL_POST_REV_8_21_14_020_45_12]|uniref:UDP-N-acetylglucosamine diphosphorylase n=1 Tax=Candidatus Kerfeldbacteria bacterium CG15_BIG_FIL_POST_REV_8_21_14_020_45_12 TaxID=2014247 RepID=A0A2M7H4I2_9BACT|nr:MAG: UDP-N-acetylglucosamine diphosphorylase [Candidatus Kerfeldbacteria bacterium CG15_BIG_FIL_POST_REV_8_21_14_020_45_12]PJA92938.1 MAG: UDP-N-acetylglucosamine diphosphorylase [Candidatus Kerfeldbacteria bacterium CG_4_9_14_3_um_filter_45_8]
MSELTTNELFDLTHTKHAELFDDVEYAWEVIPLIEQYLEYIQKSPKIQGTVSKLAVIEGKVSLGKGSVVEAGAVIHGPTIIGENTTIRSGALIRGGAIIGDNCMVGNSTEIKNALLFDGAIAPHFNYIGDTVLGYKVHLGSSVVISNLKTPPGEIVVSTLQQTYNTGLTKFGALIGDETEIGANAVLNPGTVIGKRCIIYPLALIRGVVTTDSIVKVRQQHEVVTRRQTEFSLD